MKELIATARNLYYKPNDDGSALVPVVELILVTSEPGYLADFEDGSVTLRKNRTTESVRITCSLESLRLLLKSTIDVIGEITEQENESTAPTRESEGE